jgi:hypothetical protein
MTVADARQFVASRGARRSGIAAPLWHIWLPAAPLRQLAISYEHACKSSPALHLMHALRSNDGVRWAVSWRARRTPRAKETGLTRRLGDDERAEGSDDERAEGSADGAYS